MISIVISTHNPIYFKQITQNIIETIGVEYELVSIENHHQYSICEAYNIGAKRAKFEYVCFVHEDVLFKTADWGKRLIDLMKTDVSIGLIGIAGSKFKSTYPTTGWGTGPFVSKFWRGNYFTGLQNEVYCDLDKSLVKKEVEDALIVDGAFLFTKSEVLQSCKFDSEMLTNFHGYDTDFSLQVYFNSYRVLVDRGLSLLHYSAGDTNAEFAKANRLILHKWKSKLPVATKDCKLSKVELLYYNILVWIGYLWYAFTRKVSKLKLRT